jgi:hypothetical protein
MVLACSCALAAVSQFLAQGLTGKPDTAHSRMLPSQSHTLAAVLSSRSTCCGTRLLHGDFAVLVYPMELENIFGHLNPECRDFHDDPPSHTEW